ncbi:MAG: hypothetical protein IKR48_11125 [Kiritimatiellae bacterium]|nr:hypothetical protein [Kiritimatiellia bacterium]
MEKQMIFRAMTVTLLVTFSAGAVDLTELADTKFAERYAFSTNRTETIKTLRPGTDAWFAYSILNAQTEGRLDEAKKLNNQWTEPNGGNRRLAFAYRQDFLDWDRGKCQAFFIPQHLQFLHIWEGLPEREVELKPNAYPSELKDEELSFEAFMRMKQHFDFSNLEAGYESIGLREDAQPLDGFHTEILLNRDFLPDTPGLMKYVLRYLTDGDKNHFFKKNGVFKNLTLDQLAEVARATKGTAKDVAASAVFADIVLAKLTPGADDDPNDLKLREDLLKRRLDFTKTLAPALKQKRVDAERELLEFYRSVGDLSHKELFLDYLKDIKPEHGLVDGGDRVERMITAIAEGRKVARGDALVLDYLAALAGENMKPFSELIEKDFLVKTVSEAELLAGRPATEVNVSVFSANEFKQIQERVELNWANSNQRVFAAKDRVSLAIDVKNVQKMRIAIYELDATAACREAKGEVSSDIDLDCAVPTVQRFLDFSDKPSILRHRETLAFPELDEPGLYVVECSGNGVSSRAVVRKGRLRATERRDAAGHVFAALDEDGKIVKGTKVWLDGTVFTADKNGEVSVPFVADKKSAGRKTAIIGAGRLASAIEFDHAVETYSLDLCVVLPEETLVAGREATALIRPILRTGGVVSPLQILENPTLTVTFRGAKNRVTVKTYKDFALFDNAESVFRFQVPWNLSGVEFKLEGRVKHVTDGEDERLSAFWSTRNVNKIAQGNQIEQLLMRRTSEGYILECRGRTGEAIPYHAIPLVFKHHAFKSAYNISKTLQCDKNGVIRLGMLKDIEKVRTDAFGKWEWWSEDWMELPCAKTGIASAEGEVISFPARGLLDGAWPGADKLENRVSLLAINKAGEITKDCVHACSYSNGVLRIAGLRAGNYHLTFRTETTEPIQISVAKTAKGVGEGGVIASVARSLTDTGDPNGLRIESAEVTTNGVLRVRITNAGANARVHVFAARTMPEMPSLRPFHIFALELEGTELREGTWGGVRTDYISGRDLGDKLRYILDRRQESGRIGNMLQRPSLLLNPWTTSETNTKEVKLSEGDGWVGAPPASAAPEERMEKLKAYGGSADSSYRKGFVCFDFLPESEAVFANLRPGKNGMVEVALHPRAAGMQDVSVVVTDGRFIDEVRIAGTVVPFAPRDLRVKQGFDALSNSSRTKLYSTVGELYSLLKPILSSDKNFTEFGFIADWETKGENEKRELYGKYASHELDFFLYEKDRAFFDSVVAPNLRNKRLKDFMDKWLLGEDLGEYAKSGRLQDLNALEQCLLARRVSSLAPAVARNLADWCEINPVAPEDEDRLFAVALSDMEKIPGVNLDKLQMTDEPKPEAPEAEPRDMSAWSSQRTGWSGKVEADVERKAPMRRAAQVAGAGMSQKMALERRNQNRQFYRPPERTKEWVESYWYRRRHAEDTMKIIQPNRFWRDYAEAIAKGKTDSFRSENIIYAADVDRFSGTVAALAVSRIGFEAKEGESVVFSRSGGSRFVASADRDTLRIERHFFHSDETNEDGSLKEATDEFVRGRVYTVETIVINPTAKRRYVRVVSQIPEGAFALGGCDTAEDETILLDAYATRVLPRVPFYFPLAEQGIGKVPDAVALERGKCVGTGGQFVCNVVAESAKRDTTSWRYVSQKATKEEVLEYLKTKNLTNVDLTKIGWRFADGEFAKKALDILESRGVYCQGLWLAGFKWKDAYDAQRVKEALSRRENVKKLVPQFGPVFKSSLIEIEPEEADVFEHKEYWPIINARTHAKGAAATIPNATFAKEYRAFLDVLAAKRELSIKDRLLAAVYLIAQDRIAEAETQIAAVDAADVETKMQLDYMKAYLAFAHGNAAEGRKIAAKWADETVGIWQRHFQEVVAQADEAMGVNADGERADAALAPTLSVRADMTDGVVAGVILTAQNLTICMVKAYPIDMEIGFSKNPFGGVSATVGGMRNDGTIAVGGVLGLKPAWSKEVSLKEGEETRVSLPEDLRRSNLVFVVTGADGRAEERLELTPGTLDVQVSRETRLLRVRDRKGKPIAGAYVKVYVRNSSGLETKFHKDGYTDLRGTFNYEAVSTDTDFRPAEFAIFVQSTEGVRTLILKKE